MFVYLASPYAHPDPAVMAERFHQVCQAVAHFLSRDITVYSPIAHNHYLATQFSLPRTWDFWKNPDLDMLSKASAVWVLELPGWEQSQGISAEVMFATKLGLPVKYISWEEICGEDSGHLDNGFGGVDAG